MTPEIPTAAPKAPSRGPQIIIAICVTVAVTLVLTFVLRKPADQVTAKMTAYKIVSPTTFEVTFEVNKAYIAEATCRIEAIDENFQVIGAIDGYKVGPQIDHHRKTLHTVEIPVTGVPVTGRVESCVITRDH